MRNDYLVVIRVQDQDVFDQFVDAENAKAALEIAVEKALTRDLSGIKSSREIYEERRAR